MRDLKCNSGSFPLGCAAVSVFYLSARHPLSAGSRVIDDNFALLKRAHPYLHFNPMAAWAWRTLRVCLNERWMSAICLG
jgi:hypothetical protein